MKKFMAIRVTICEGSSLNSAHMYYSDAELGLELSTHLSYTEGMKQLRQLEKRLNRLAQLTINQYNPTISYKNLSGYLDRE